MGFYFCGSYINTDADENEVERDMYTVVSYFWGSHDRYEYKEWKIIFEEIFSYFSLTSEHKYHYAQMRLVGEAYWW